jgi:hypothetical protein
MGYCHEILDPRFCSLNNPPLGPWFTGWSRFADVFFVPLKGMRALNRFREWSRGLIDPTGSTVIPRSQWHRRIWSRGVNYTADPLLIETEEPFTKMSKSAPAVSLALPDLNDDLDFCRRTRSHMRNGFSPSIRALGDCLMKKPRVENLVTLSL